MIGLTLDYSAMRSDAPTERVTAPTATPIPPDDIGKPNPFLAETPQQHVTRLEQELARANEQIAALEHALQEPLNSPPEEEAEPKKERVADIGTGETLTIENLVRSGVSEILAEEIINRVNRYDFKRLQLQNRATREGYLKTSRYYVELRKLSSEAISLRDEIGTEAYDRYLYLTDKNNRVLVTSIIPDTPAALYGIRKGDVIVRYGENRILDLRDIRQTTAATAQSEYLNLTLLRDGELMNIAIPGGALGIKIGATRLDPEIGSQY